MKKPIAPKDMTFKEGIAEFRKRYEKKEFSLPIEFFLRKMEEMLVEPAPNPFTHDQLAYLRERQRSGLNYAAKDGNGVAYEYQKRPCKSATGRTWSSYEGETVRMRDKEFLVDFLSCSDEEPFCYADYAPLEEGEKK